MIEDEGDGGGIEPDIERIQHRARHRHAEVRFGLFEDCGQELAELPLETGRRVHDEQAEIGSDEFVATAAGVQLPAERAELVHQGAFDEVVDVFGGRTFEKSFVAGYFVLNALQAAERVADLDVGQDTDLLQCPGPRTIYRELVR